MTTLLTFVGRTEANRQYKPARYRFDDGIVVESKLFAAAAVQWLRRTGSAPGRLLIVGTPTSGWDVLMEVVERLAPAKSEEALEWAIPVSDALAEGPVDPASLRDFEGRFSAALGSKVDLVLARNDGDSIFERLDEALAPKERVILDITHSFRSMPVHALVAIGAMRWLKGVELCDVIYGSLDERDAENVSSARSLGATSALAAATPALAQLALVDDVGGIAPYLAGSTPVLRTHLADTQRLESIMQFDKAGTPRGQALGLLRRFEGGAAERVVAAKVADTLDSLGLGSGSKGLLNRARRALGRSDYMRAVGLANEALALKMVERHDLMRKAEQEVRAAGPGATDFYRSISRLARGEIERNAGREGAPRIGDAQPLNSWRTLSVARNAVMHAGAGLNGQQPPRALLSPEALRELLEWSFRFYEFLD